MKASSWAKYSCVVKILFRIWSAIKATRPFQKHFLVGHTPGPQAALEPFFINVFYRHTYTLFKKKTPELKQDFNPTEMLPGMLDSPSENSKEIGFLEVQTFISLLKPDIFKAAK